MVTASVQRLIISWSPARMFYRGAVVLSVPMSRDRSKDPESTLRLCGLCSGRRGRSHGGGQMAFPPGAEQKPSAASPSGGFLWTVPAVVHRHVSRADVYISPGIMRLGVRWCDGPQRFTLDNHTTSSRYGHPVRTRMRARRRRPPPGRGGDMRHSQRASLSRQDPSAGDYVLQERPTRRSR